MTSSRINLSSLLISYVEALIASYIPVCIHTYSNFGCNFLTHFFHSSVGSLHPLYLTSSGNFVLVSEEIEILDGRTRVSWMEGLRK